MSKLSVTDQANMVRLSGDGNYTNLKRPQLYARPISVFERAFTSFVREHKKHLVNPVFVRNLQIIGNEISYVVMMDGTELPVSRKRVAEIRDKLTGVQID